MFNQCLHGDKAFVYSLEPCVMGFICCDGGPEMASYFLLRLLAALRLENHLFLNAT